MNPIYQVQTTDGDLLQNAEIQYSIEDISPPEDKYFDIGLTSGYISLLKKLDYEKYQSHTVSIFG